MILFEQLNATNNDKYRFIGEYTKDAKARRLLGQRYVDDMTVEEIVRLQNGDSFLDDHSERVRKKKLDTESKKLAPLFDDFEKFLEHEIERLKEEAE